VAKLKCKNCGKKFEPNESPNYPEEGPNDTLTCPECESENWEPTSIPAGDPLTREIALREPR